MSADPLAAPLAADAAVRQAAADARLALPADAADALGAWLRDAVAALNAALDDVRAGPDGVAVGVGAGGMPLREDAGPPYAMARPARELAGDARLGYVLVPRLAGEPVRPGRDRAPAVRDAIADDAFAAELERGA